MIEKVLVYGWFGGKEKPRKIEKCIQSWKINAPEYHIQELNESNCDIERYDYTKEAYQQGHFAFVWDFFRIQYLLEHSAITIDSDIEIIKPFDCFLNHSGFTSTESSGKWISAVIASEKNTKWVQNIMKYYFTHKFEYSPSSITNTVIIDEINKKMFHHEKDGVIYLDGGIAIYDRKYFEAKNWATGQIEISPQTHSIHHYSKSWV